MGRQMHMHASITNIKVINDFNYQIACTWLQATASLLSDSESTQKINQNQETKLNTKNVIFSKPVEMFCHPVDR